MSANKQIGLSKKHKSLINLILRCIIVFMLPVITGLAFFKNCDIHPYGENSLLSVDLWGQYFPMYRQFADTNSFSEAMFSWNGALGFNNFVQSAFYCRSPFLLLFKLIPIDYSIIYINMVCLARLGLSAVTCLLFLEYKFKKKSPIVMAASVSYGLCAYAIAFIMQFMWTDLIVITPLILIGLEKLIEGKSPVIYVASLALAIYTNFYVAFGICLFTAFYFLAETAKSVEFNNNGKLLNSISNFKSINKSTVRFAVYSILAGAVNAVIAIPTLVGLSKSMSANEGKLDFTEWYHTLADNINAMLPQTEISLAYGVANIATGLFMFILIPLYFFNTSIKFRDKAISGAFILLLYSGLNYNPMDYVFNGFHFPNQLPGRWSFLFSLAIVIIAVNGITKIEGIKQKSVISSYIVGVFFLLMAKYGNITPMKLEMINTWIGWLTIFSILVLLLVSFTQLHIHSKSEAAENNVKLKETEEITEEISEKLSEEITEEITEEISEKVSDDYADVDKNTINPENNKSSKKKSNLIRSNRICKAAISLTIAILMTYEVCSNVIEVATSINGGVGTSNMKHYLNATNIFAKYGEMYDSGHNDFYRIENNNGWTFNDGQLGGYKGMTYYGSTLNGNTFKFLRYFGNRVYAQNVSTLYNTSSIIQNSIFGIRYFIDRGKNLNERLPGIEKIEDFKDCTIWKNPTVLPIAFAVSENAENIKITDQIRPITSQNNFINMMYGEDVNVFERQHNTALTYENCELSENDVDWNHNHFYCHDTSTPVKFNYTFTCTNEQPVYIEQNFRAGKMHVNVGDVSKEVSIETEPFKYIGTFPVGTEINVSVEVIGVGIGCFGVDFYTFNTQKWQNVYNKFNSNIFEVTSFKNTKIEGTINLENPELIYTSIPQDGGWKVYVDGKKVDDILIADTLVGFRANAGTHEITFKYHVPGYIPGLLITIISLILIVFCIYYGRKKSKSMDVKVDKSNLIKGNAVIINKSDVINDENTDVAEESIIENQEDSVTDSSKNE